MYEYISWKVWRQNVIRFLQKTYYQTQFDQLNMIKADLQPAKKLKDLFIDNNRNG